MRKEDETEVLLELSGSRDFFSILRVGPKLEFSSIFPYIDLGFLHSILLLSCLPSPPSGLEAQSHLRQTGLAGAHG